MLNLGLEVAKFEKLDTPLPYQGNHTGAKLQLQNVSKFGANFHIDVDHTGSLTDSNPCSNHLCDYKREINVFQMYRDGE